MPAASDTTPLRIRMYKIGFGDAFLFTIPTSDGDRLLLLDFGQHIGGRNQKMSVVAKDIERVVKARPDGRQRIDVVVATHRHFDHIAGFGLKAMKSLPVGEVWLPWTEERGNPAADRIRSAQNRLALAMEGVRGLSPQARLILRNLYSLSNQDAEKTLLGRFGGVARARFLPHADRDRRTFTSEALPGVTVHAMGPSHDPDVIADMEPPPGSFFLPAAEGGSVARDSREPFAEKFRYSISDFESRMPQLGGVAQVDELDRLARYDLAATAAALEDAVNGTSLVLMLEIDNAMVLLAGDAEWGTWNEIMNDAQWSELLTQTTLYKVSHHGSFNGTPLEYVSDLMPDDAISVVSLMAGQPFESIPRATLLNALAEQQRTLIRSDLKDAEANALPQVVANSELFVELEIPTE